MTIQSVLGAPIVWPYYQTDYAPPINVQQSNPAFTNSNWKIGYVFNAGESCDVSSIWALVASIIGNTPDWGIDARLETVNSSNEPTGTLVQAGATGTLSIGPTEDNSAKEFVLTTDCPIVAGTRYAVVLEPSTVPTNSPSIRWYTAVVDHVTHNANWLSWASSTWTTNSNGYSPVFALEKDDGTFVYNHGCLFFDTNSGALNYNNTDNPNIYAIRFQVPFKCRACGVQFGLDTDNNSSATGQLELQEDDGTVLATCTIDNDVITTTGSRTYSDYFDSRDEVTLDVDTWYRLTLEPTSANDLKVSRWRYPENAALAVFPGGVNVTGQSWNGSSWDNDTDERIKLHLLLNGFDDGVGSGSSNTQNKLTLNLNL